jgi:uncharacterized protein YjbI with pentapeptide repeats
MSEKENVIPGITSANLSRIEAIYEETHNSLAALLLAAGLDLARALRDADLRGWNFSNVDVRGVDFTNSNLTGTRFEEAHRDDTTILTGSNLEESGRSHLESEVFASSQRSYDALTNLYIAVTSAQSILEQWVRDRDQSDFDPAVSFRRDRT